MPHRRPLMLSLLVATLLLGGLAACGGSTDQSDKVTEISGALDWIAMLFGGSYFIASNIAPRLIEHSAPRLVYMAAGGGMCATGLLYP